MSRCPFARFNRAIGLQAPETGEIERAAEAKGMRMALQRGSEDGCYRRMLKAISTGHSTGQKLRGAMFVAGLLTDKK